MGGRCCLSLGWNLGSNFLLQVCLDRVYITLSRQPRSWQASRSKRAGHTAVRPAHMWMGRGAGDDEVSAGPNPTVID